MDVRRRTKQRYTVTAALPYANGPKHVGHLAGAYLPADVYARYLRLAGKEVIFVCGSDENGTAIPNRAIKEGSTPKKIIDKYHVLTRDCLYKLGISFDVYYRTSDPLHHKTAKAFFTTLVKKKVLFKKTTQNFYDEKAKTFLADRYLIGMCPRCGHVEAHGDQCEQCGSALNAEELIMPRSTLTGGEPVYKTTTHWYLPLDDHEMWLRKWMAGRKLHNWKPSVVGQCNGWLDSGLQSRPMTRDLDWGVKVPRMKKKALYVWFEAPIGYISATKALFAELASGKKKYATPQRDFGKVEKDDWKKYWQGNTKLIHFVGKDNIVFHCIIFPIILHSVDGGYITPHNVPANEFMNLEGDKMSTSKGWSVGIHEYLEAFPNRPDALRYALLSRLPEAKDSEFTWKSYKNKHNSELLAVLGNFINRAMVLVHKHFKGKVPAIGTLNETDKGVIEALKESPSAIGNAIEAFQFKDATMLMMGVARLGNKYLTDTEPWQTVKTDKKRAKTILHLALQITANIAVLSAPFIPFTAEKIREMLAMKPTPWRKAGSITMLKKGHQLNETVLLYEIIDNKIVPEQIKYLEKKRHQKIVEKLKNS